MGVLKMLEAIEAWQRNPNLHPLTCCNCNHVNLIGKIIPTGQMVVISSQEGSDIILECPQCDYVQENIPDCVYQWYIDNHMNYTIPLGQVVDLEITEDCGADAIFYGKDYKFSKDREFMKTDDSIIGDQVIVLRFLGNLRALVVGHSRDCDGTPLYCLGNIRVQYDGDELYLGMHSRIQETICYKKWASYLQTGWSEDSLKIIEGQIVPLLYKSIFEYEENMAQSL